MVEKGRGKDDGTQSDAAKPQIVQIMMEKGGKEKHYGTQKTKRECD